MNRIALLSASFVAAGLVLGCAPAVAQASRTWVSGVGDDANPCSRTAPCKTFAGAISKTAAKGEINTIDPGGFGAVTITKAITIDGGGGHTAGILASGTNGVVVNAGAGDVIQLRNLDISGFGNGLNGIRFIAGGALIVENVNIFNFTQKAIDFEPGGNAQLVVRNATLSNNAGASGGAVFVKPGAGAVAVAELVGVKAIRSLDGLRVFERTRASVQDSLMSGNAVGAAAQCSAAPCEINIERSMFSNNTFGVATIGAAATVRLSNVGIFKNATGISAPSGAVVSFGNNQIAGNGTNGAPTATSPQQ